MLNQVCRCKSWMFVNWKDRKRIKGWIAILHLIAMASIPEKSMTKILNVWKLERKKNGRNKGMYNSSSLIPVLMIHTSIVHMCNKFLNLVGLTVPEKKATKISDVRKLGKRKIKGQISSSILILVYTIHPPIVDKCTKCQLCRLHSSTEKSDQFSCLIIGEKEKSRNKGMNKHQQPDSSIPYSSLPIVQVCT